MRLKSLQDQSKESPIILERSISRQWSSLGLEERRPFYEEAERIREALQQSHLPQQLQNFNNRVNGGGLATESSEASEEPAEKRARLSLENEPVNDNNDNDEAHVSPGSPPASPPAMMIPTSPEKTSPLSPISSNSQSPQMSSQQQRRKKQIAPARRLPDTASAVTAAVVAAAASSVAKVEVKVEM